MKTIVPIHAIIDPDTEDMQSWAEINAHDLHGVSVEAAHVMSSSLLIDEVVLVHFMWDDEVYADLFIKRNDIIEAVENAMDYYVSIEFYEQAAYVKSIIDKLKENC